MTSAAATTPKYLAIYLNDHLAGATAGAELAARAEGENRGTPLGAFVTGLRREIEEDRRALEEVMALFGVSRDRLKVSAAWAGEKAGRLKLNGRLRGYSPLSTVVELEALSLGVEAKRLMWVALSEEETIAARVGADRLTDLARRAGRQREALEGHRLEAIRRALAA